MANAPHCRIEQCRFENIGGYGVWLHLDSCENAIDGNTITDAGGGGVLLTSARFSYMQGGNIIEFNRVENNIIFNTVSGGLQFNAGDNNEFVNNIVVGDTTRWDTKWRGANAQGTMDERNLVVKSKDASAPLRDPARGDFTLSKDFAKYPAGFAWIDVNQIGTGGTAKSGVEMSAMARQGGVLNWDSPQGVEIRGPWEKKTAAGMWGLYSFNYLLAEPKTDAAVTFALPVQAAGRYAVRLNFPAHTNRASNVCVVVEHAGGTAIEQIDQRSFGFGLLLGLYDLVPDKPARVTISTTQADGRVAIEGIGFARASESSKRLAPAAGPDRSGHSRRLEPTNQRKAKEQP